MINTKVFPKQTMIQTAYDGILTRISDGKLKPSSFISHRNLAEELQISKQPVSIALQWLEHDGVVESIPRVGTRVQSVTPEDVWGMHQWRLGLECRVISLACEFASNKELDELAVVASKIDQSIKQPDVPLKKLRCLDTEFHLQMANTAHCAKLRMELSKLNIYFLKSTLCEVVHITREMIPPEPEICHVKLVEVIQKRNSMDASELLKKHLESSRDIKAFIKWYKNRNKNDSYNENI